jgi:hypothetical protein
LARSGLANFWTGLARAKTIEGNRAAVVMAHRAPSLTPAPCSGSGGTPAFISARTHSAARTGPFTGRRSLPLLAASATYKKAQVARAESRRLPAPVRPLTRQSARVSTFHAPLATERRRASFRPVVSRFDPHQCGAPSNLRWCRCQSGNPPSSFCVRRTRTPLKLGPGLGGASARAFSNFGDTLGRRFSAIAHLTALIGVAVAVLLSGNAIAGAPARCLRRASLVGVRTGADAQAWPIVLFLPR